MSDFLVLKGKTWYVRIDVPAHARDFGPINGRKVLSKSLKTSSLKEAKDRSHRYLAEWKELFAAAASYDVNIPSAEEIESSRQRRDALLREPGRALAEAAERVGQERALEEVGAELSFLEWEINAWDSYWLLSDESLEKYREYAVSRERIALKTLDARIAAIKKIRVFLQANNLGMDDHGVGRYLEESTAAPNTKRNHLQAGSDYWRFLGRLNREFRTRKNPFLGQEVDGGGRVPRRHVEPDELRKLYLAACKRASALSALIKLAAYTGARIEELCQLKVEDVRDGYLVISDAKTDAGNREVPIHSEIERLVAFLKSVSSDGYLIRSTSKNKYGIRSDTLSKRFGRLRTEEGFGREVVFHSIRKTFITLLEQAGIPENITADIVGHEKKTMSYGLYSGGTSMDQKRAAIEKVKLNLDES